MAEHIVEVVQRPHNGGQWRGPAYQARCSCGWVGDQQGIRSNAEHLRMRHDLLNQYPPIDRHGRRPETYYQALEDLDRTWLVSVLCEVAW